MLAAKSLSGCPAATGVSVRWVERSWRDRSEDASFAAPPLNAKIESLVMRLLCRWSRTE